MKLTIGFSPCPNDTYIFEAMVNKNVDTEGIDFEVYMEDVETLNEWSLQGKLDITKLSYGVFPLVAHQYQILNTGSALGQGVGPLLIAPPGWHDISVTDTTIAIPGKNTTAHLLFSNAYPLAQKKIFISYEKIEQFVTEEKGLGVIIHENRFTYQEKGLVCLKDLGLHWESTTGKPIPLGGIMIKKEFDNDLKQTIDRILLRSLQYASHHPNPITPFIIQHAQELSPDVMLQHIKLYVNDFSLHLGATGREAILTLLSKASFTSEQFSEAIFVKST